MSVTAGYYRRDFYNLQVNDNQTVALTDWSAPFNISTPTDPRLPLSGQPIPLYTLNTNKANVATDTLVTYSTANKTTYNGIEFTANVRRDKWIVFGGITTDKRTTITCDGDTTASTARDTPNGARFCDAIQPFRTTVKASAAYSFPHDINVSGSFTSIPGPSVNANYTVTSAIAGRPILGSPTATSIVVNLVQPGTVFLDYQNRLDLRRRQDVQARPQQDSGLHGRLQRVQLGHGAHREPDLRGVGHEPVDVAGDHHGRPLPPVRHAAEFLI